MVLPMDEQATDEQRAGKRIEVGGPATLHDDGINWAGFIKNVSSRGVFFACSQAGPGVGRQVTLTCEGRLGVIARVAWLADDGCGLELIKPV